MSSSSQAPESWISAFCSIVGHEYFAEVSEDFVEDDFNLTGLQSQVPMYKEALEMILDVEPEDATDDEDEEEEEEDEDDDDMEDGNGVTYRVRAEAAAAAAAERRHLRMASDLSMIENSAETLYGLIHQRFITSRAGIQQMAEKYELGHFGYCPRVHCHGAKVLPVGCSDIPGQETVKLFCPSCLDVYTPPNSRFQTVDGAFFGTTFGCLFFMTFPELDVAGNKPVVTDMNTLTAPRTESRPPKEPWTKTAPDGAQPETIHGVAAKNLAPGLGAGNIYEPKIYGFRVAEVAKNGPRMKWLRMRPSNELELDEARNMAYLQQMLTAPSAGRVEGSSVTIELADSEMADEHTAIDEDDLEEENLDPSRGSHREQVDSAQAREISQHKKGSRRRQNGDMIPGNDGAGGTAVRVGDGG